MAENHLYLHQITGIRLKTYTPANDNAISLLFDGQDGGVLEVTAFGIKAEDAKRITSSLGDAETSVRTPEGNLSLIDWMTINGVFDSMEIKG